MIRALPRLTVPSHSAVAQRRLGAGQVGVQVPGRAHQLIGAEPGLPQRISNLIRSELGILGRRVPPVQLCDHRELAGRRVGLDPVPRAQHPDQLRLRDTVITVVPDRGVSGDR
jgi:hypothetical protein